VAVSRVSLGLGVAVFRVGRCISVIRDDVAPSGSILSAIVDRSLIVVVSKASSSLVSIKGEIGDMLALRCGGVGKRVLIW